MATVSEIRDPVRPLQVALPNRSLAQRVYLLGTWLMLVLIIVQFAAAGAGVFSRAAVSPHHSVQLSE